MNWLLRSVTTQYFFGLTRRIVVGSHEVVGWSVGSYDGFFFSFLFLTWTVLFFPHVQWSRYVHCWQLINGRACH